jgi:magnesium transporter
LGEFILANALKRERSFMTIKNSQGLPAERETAGSHMVTRIPRATVDTPVNTVIQSLRGRKFECADTVFVTDVEGRLKGIVRINDLFAGGECRIDEIMEPRHEAVGHADDQEQIALLAMQLNMIAVPVIDDDDRLIGAVPPEALLGILRAEHMEDIQRLAGIAPDELGPSGSLSAPLYDRFRRRIPWLVFGLLASSIITFVMAGFEQSLSVNLTVAFFVPALVYIAGAIGTQAVSVAVRGLAADNIPIAGLLRDELIIGMAIGASLGLLSMIMGFVAFGDGALSLAIGLAVFGGGTVSAMVGFSLPWVFDHFGSDPALGSGPICTIIQDVASLSIYFALVSTFVV